MDKMMLDNYKEIYLVAKKISPKHSKELINETYIDLHHINPPQTNLEFIKFFSKGMSNRVKWSKSNFNKAIKINDFNFITDIPIKTEPPPLDINKLKECLEMHERELFALHYEHKLSARQIAELLEKENNTKECYQSYQRLINQMKTKLNKWKQLNL